MHEEILLTGTEKYNNVYLREHYLKNKRCRIEYSKVYQKKNKVAVNYNHKVRQRKIRLEVLTHYSKGILKCACCGETILQFLCIDHINGGGNKHKKEIKRSNVYEWLKQYNYPEGYQVLCHNCNLAKGFYGKCPHESK